MNAVYFNVCCFVECHAFAAAINFDNQSARVLDVIIVVSQKRSGGFCVEIQAAPATRAVKRRAERVTAIRADEVAFALPGGSADDAVSEFLAGDSVIQDRLRWGPMTDEEYGVAAKTAKLLLDFRELV